MNDATVAVLDDMIFRVFFLLSFYLPKLFPCAIAAVIKNSSQVTSDGMGEVGVGDTGNSTRRAEHSALQFDIIFTSQATRNQTINDLYQRTKWRRKVRSSSRAIRTHRSYLVAKSRTVAVRLISMALTGYYKTLVRPRTHRPLSMMKYDPVGTEYISD